MAKLTVGKGIDKYIGQLEKLNLASDDMIRESVYKGAKLLTDAIDANIDALPVNDTGWYTGTQGDKISSITRSQKAGLKESLGIADIRDDGGFKNMKVGFDGYNSTKTKKYPKGQPNAMIARSIDSGTSFRAKHPFVTSAVRNNKDSAERAMAKEMDERTKDIFK